MLSRKVFLPIAIAALMQSGLVFAQPGPGFEMPGGITPPNARFENAPQVGEQFPDLTIVDAQGNPVNIRELASRSPYTVLTLGCLT